MTGSHRLVSRGLAHPSYDGLPAWARAWHPRRCFLFDYNSHPAHPTSRRVSSSHRPLCLSEPKGALQFSSASSRADDITASGVIPDLGAYEALLWRKLQRSRASQPPSEVEPQPEQLTMPPDLERWFQQGLVRAERQQPSISTLTSDTLERSGPDLFHPLLSKRLAPEQQHQLLDSTCSMLSRGEVTAEEAVARVKRRLAILAVHENSEAIDFEARAVLLRRYVGNASARGTADSDTFETAKAFYLAHFACPSRDPTMSAELVKLHQKACYRLFDWLISSRSGAQHGRMCAAILAEAYMRPSDSKHLMKRLISYIVAEGQQAKMSRSEKHWRSKLLSDTVDELAKSVMSLVRSGKLLLHGRQKDRQLLEGILSLLSWHFESTPLLLEFVELAQRQGQWRERALEHSLRILLCQPSVGTATHKDSLDLSGRYQAALGIFFDLAHPDQRSKQLHLIMLQAFGEAPLEQSSATAEQDEDPHARVWASLMSNHPGAISEMPTYEARFVSHALHGTPRRALLDLVVMGKLGVVRAHEGTHGPELMPDFEQLPAKLLEHAGSAFHAAALRAESRPQDVT